MSIILLSYYNSMLNSSFTDYKNIYLLRKFIVIQGKILPRRLNKITAKQQRLISKSIKRARIIGLLPFVNKDN
uniref:Small ribosomal subunit protein bS18c n=1 Tax=Trachelomonas volvocina TaxID=103340 RepID=A0A0G3VP35_9EUGL|nr:ribosomal protein S18 [Trachelomonas volvocina]AKL82421.1 ribosomal protein S18 [Trachelomonas volvocina]